MNCKKFGAYIRSIRYEKGYSVTEAAKFIGISTVQLHNIEKGANLPRPTTFMKIVNGLGLDVKEAVNMFDDDERTDTIDERELQN